MKSGDVATLFAWLLVIGCVTSAAFGALLVYLILALLG